MDVATWAKHRTNCRKSHVVRFQHEADHLRAAYASLRQETELLQLRIFVAKAVRIDSAYRSAGGVVARG